LHTLEQLRSGALHGAQRLTLRAGLRELPEEVYTLADTLEVLDLSGNELDALPADLPRLHRLRVIFCANNRFTRLPEVLGRCEALEMVGFKANQIDTVPAAALPPQLRWLILTDNRIATLPDELGRRPRLQKVALAGNRLTALPATLAACERLERLGQPARWPARLAAHAAAADLARARRQSVQHGAGGGCARTRAHAARALA
jgi:Leucine-rich repeat (LRR) protein